MLASVLGTQRRRCAQSNSMACAFTHLLTLILGCGEELYRTRNSARVQSGRFADLVVQLIEGGWTEGVVDGHGRVLEPPSMEHKQRAQPPVLPHVLGEEVERLLDAAVT